MTAGLAGEAAAQVRGGGQARGPLVERGGAPSVEIAHMIELAAQISVADPARRNGERVFSGAEAQTGEKSGGESHDEQTNRKFSRHHTTLRTTYAHPSGNILQCDILRINNARPGARPFT